MNDNRITSLGHPKESSDAVTIQWMTQQLKDGMKDIDDLESEFDQRKMEMKRLQEEYDASITGLTKKLTALKSI